MPSLNGPRAKVKRAKSQLITLQASFERHFKLYPYSIVVAEFDRKAGHYPLRIQGGSPNFPDEWGVLIGEIAHNLRSALDLLTWQLALLSKLTPSDDTQFPIFLIGRTKRRLPNNNIVPHFWIEKKRVPRYLQSVDRRFWKRIEAFQPYKGRNGNRHSPLFLLHKLNNADKHRLITVLATTVSGMSFTGAAGGSKFKIGMPIHTNAKVGYVLPLPPGGIKFLDTSTMEIKTQHEVQAYLNITPCIRFGDGCDAVKRLPVIRTLTNISNEVSRIIESFAGDF